MTAEAKPAVAEEDNLETADVAEETDDAVDETTGTEEAKKGDADLLQRVFSVLLRRPLMFSVVLTAAVIAIILVA
ncbi:hypothetical protein [Mycobacteroides abscessus]|uniref:hypothetical protein n=1 Tax=Mycobacteroides abscessus TaxID=36809 RepID=UPI003AF69AB0